MLNAFIGSPPEISQYSCHAQSGGGELYAGGAVTGRSPYFNCFQVLKGSTREKFNKRAKAVLRLDKTRVASLLDLHLVLWSHSLFRYRTKHSYSCLQYRIGHSSKDKSKTMLMQTFGGKSMSIKVFWKKVYKAFLHDVTVAKTIKRWPCWWSKPILLELNSFIMLTLSSVSIHLHRYWPPERKRCIREFKQRR